MDSMPLSVWTRSRPSATSASLRTTRSAADHFVRHDNRETLWQRLDDGFRLGALVGWRRWFWSEKSPRPMRCRALHSLILHLGAYVGW